MAFLLGMTYTKMCYGNTLSFRRNVWLPFCDICSDWIS